MKALFGLSKPGFVFLFSFCVFSFYFLGSYPGFYSRDVIDCLRFILAQPNHLDFLLLNSFGISTFFKFYIYFFYLISSNLFLLGFFQILISSLLILFCWKTLAELANEKIAWLVGLLMIFSPLNGFIVGWYHRSVLFGYLVFLNLVLLYRFSKKNRLGNRESIIFILNLLFISFLRMDGLIISGLSMLTYIFKAKIRRQAKIMMVSIFALASILNLIVIPVYKETGNTAYLTLPLVYQIRRIHQNSNTEFSRRDLNALGPVITSISERKDWLEGDYRTGARFDSYLSPGQIKDFIKWSAPFIFKNSFAFLKTQSEVFLRSSLLKGGAVSFYFHSNAALQDDPGYLELKTKIDLTDRPWISGAGKLRDLLMDNDYRSFLDNPVLFARGLFLGTFFPFTFLLIVFPLAFKYRRESLVPLAPLFFYCIFMFLFQPRSKAYYWYWLAYSYYFVVIVFSYELFFALKNKACKNAD